MKKQILEFHTDAKLTENDIVMFIEGKWRIVNKSVFLDCVYRELSDNIDNVNAEIDRKHQESLDMHRELSSGLSREHSRVSDLESRIEKLEETVNYILGEEEPIEEEPVVEEPEEEPVNEEE